MEEQIIVQKDNILNLYENATIEQKLLLENIFGKDIFPQKDITEKVKTFKDAVAILGNDSLAVTNYNTIANEICTDDILAFAKLRVITEALNEGWKPNFNNGELSYYPSFHIYNNSEYEKLDDIEKNKCYPINNLDIVDSGITKVRKRIKELIDQIKRLKIKIQRLTAEIAQLHAELAAALAAEAAAAAAAAATKSSSSRRSGR